MSLGLPVLSFFLVKVEKTASLSFFLFRAFSMAFLALNRFCRERIRRGFEALLVEYLSGILYRGNVYIGRFYVVE
jgi:hypothetical protein